MFSGASLMIMSYSSQGANPMSGTTGQAIERPVEWS
jgi:hypothetical protein